MGEKCSRRQADAHCGCGAVAPSNVLRSSPQRPLSTLFVIHLRDPFICHQRFLGQAQRPIQPVEGIRGICPCRPEAAMLRL